MSRRSRLGAVGRGARRSGATGRCCDASRRSWQSRRWPRSCPRCWRRRRHRVLPGATHRRQGPAGLRRRHRARLRRLEGRAPRARASRTTPSSPTAARTRVATLTDDTLADYGANHANYDAVILATGDLGHNVANADGTTSYLSALSDTEWASLAKFERTFGIRQLSDYTAPVAGARAQRRRRRDPGRQRRHADRRRQGRLPLPQGTGADRQRRPGGRRDVRLRGHAGERRRTGRPSSPGRTAPPTSGSTRIPTTAARRWS